MTDHTYNPLERNTYEAIAYNALGRASETGTYAGYKLSHSSGNSGWSVGAVQWDFGQSGRGGKVNDLMTGYQAWANAEHRFSDQDVASLTTRLQTRGQIGNALTDDERARLNGYLRSDPGRAFVNGLSQEQIQKKWDNVGEPLSQIPWLRTLSANDPAQAAEIVAMTSKLYNQNEDKGGQLIRYLQKGEQTSEQTSEWIGSHGISGLKQFAKDAIVSGRDNTLAGVRLMNDLELGDGRISQAWREQVHTNGNVALTNEFNNNPDVQLLDGMFRNPAAGSRILAHIEEGAAARAVTITGIDADAKLEMSRISLEKNGGLSIESPNGDAFEIMREGWSKNGMPMQSEPGLWRERDRPDHTGFGSVPSAQVDSTAPSSTHPLLRQAQDAVQRLDSSLNQPRTSASDCMSASLACLAKQNGLDRIDHVVLSIRTPTAAPGERVFVVEGDLSNPASRRAHMTTEEAVRTPVAESMQQLDQLDRTQAASIAQARSLQQDAQLAGQASPRRGPTV